MEQLLSIMNRAGDYRPPHTASLWRVLPAVWELAQDTSLECVHHVMSVWNQPGWWHSYHSNWQMLQTRVPWLQSRLLDTGLHTTASSQNRISWASWFCGKKAEAAWQVQVRRKACLGPFQGIFLIKKVKLISDPFLVKDKEKKKKKKSGHVRS